ncbi:MAG TPA: helix-turn-helix transcriptional regulator [Nitrospiraceae bacterium]|nr:helix-turn-helix transcriptional regulator [Nitrospiraceae bacterium]
MAAKDSIREVLATNTRALMERRGWTQAKVAAKASLSQTHVGNVLRQEVAPTTVVITGLGKAFDLPGWLLLVPELPIEILDSKEVPDLLQTYLEAAAKPLSTLIAQRHATRKAT